MLAISLGLTRARDLVTDSWLSLLSALGKVVPEAGVALHDCMQLSGQAADG